MSRPPLEFQRIARYFRPLAGPGALDLTDDAAVMTPPPGRELVITADAMVEGVHYPAGQAPGLTARKLLRVNLSDLAAKGATPFGYLLTMAIRRDTAEDWIAGFTEGLRQDQAAFGITLLGGDSTRIDGPACLSVTMLGHAAPGRTVRRSGAKPGDGIWVTGTIGDAALGLGVVQGDVKADLAGWLQSRYELPTPRLGLPLADFASASMDISDGLVQDLGHLCRAGGVGAVIEAASVPRSPAALDCGPDALIRCLTGGDDYELLLAVPAANEAALQRCQGQCVIKLTRIGAFTHHEASVTVLDSIGKEIAFCLGGWSHF